MKSPFIRPCTIIQNSAVLLALGVGLASCTSGPAPTEIAARNEVQQLQRELQIRDSLIGDMTLTFDEIEKNIALMDDREKVLSEAANSEFDLDKRARLVHDLEAMNGLMQESRERIAELTQRLDKSSIEARGLRKKLKEIDGMLVARDSAIAGLKEELMARDFTIEQTNEQLARVEAEVVQREGIIAQQTTAMNTAYYVVGTSKELEENGVVTHNGGLIGIGKTAAVNGDVPTDRFKEVDLRQTDRVPLGAKKAHLVTEHPKDSYTIVAQGDELAYLEIKDPAAFWKMSKYMVVEVK